MNRMLGVMALAMPAGVVQAALMQDETLFQTYLQGPSYVENFDGYTSAGSLGTKSVTFGPVEQYAYTIATFASPDEPNDLWANVGALSTWSPNDGLGVTFTGHEVHAFGAIISAVDGNGSVVPGGRVLVEFSDGTSTTVHGSEFVGFVSDTSLTSVSIIVVDQPAIGDKSYPQLDHLYAAVPEPAGMLAGMGAMALLTLRWRATGPSGGSRRRFR